MDRVSAMVLIFAGSDAATLRICFSAYRDRARRRKGREKQMRVVDRFAQSFDRSAPGAMLDSSATQHLLFTWSGRLHPFRLKSERRKIQNL